MGASVVLCGPPALLPHASPGLGVCRTHDRLRSRPAQRRCGHAAAHPKGASVGRGYAAVRRSRASATALTAARAQPLPPHAIVMHPGPVNRGLELDGSLVRNERSRIERQVENGVYVRMASLERSLGRRRRGRRVRMIARNYDRSGNRDFVGARVIDPATRTRCDSYGRRPRVDRRRAARGRTRVGRCRLRTRRLRGHGAVPGFHRSARALPRARRHP